MERYLTQDGDCLSSISATHGFRRSGSVYDDSVNSVLRRRRPDRSQLLPGDVVMIPDPEERAEPADTGKRTTFYVVPEERTFLRLVVLYREKLKYRVTTDLGITEGESDASSPIEAEVPRTARKATIELWPAAQAESPPAGPSITYEIELGRLSPLDTIRGVQGRLLNLGHYRGPLDGTLTAATKAAIAAFRVAQGKPASDALDDDLRSLLAGAHDG
jgi:hypothetical protein